MYKAKNSPYFDGGVLMKIVVVKSPKVLSGLLRLVFHIKKEKEA